MPTSQAQKLASMLNLSLAEAERLVRLVQTTRESAEQQSEVEMHVKIVPARPEPETTGRAPKMPDAIGRAAAKMPPQLKQKLMAHEQKVLAWINASPANAQLFTTQPLDALRAIGVDDETIAQLASLRGPSTAAMSNIPGARIVRLTLQADPHGGTR